jgi:RNA polymerase sigma-70 factor (ECF subfamily)
MGGSDSGHPPGAPVPAAGEGGDPVAFWELVEQYRPYLRRVAAGLLGDRLPNKTDASDVVQQGLLAAYQRRAQFRGRSAGEWQGWLVAIVRNEALNLLRYWRQDRRDVRQEQALPAGSAAGPALDVSSPSRQTARREQAARLLAALDRLPPDHRQVITLRNLEDLAYADVATRMGRTEQAVRQLWVRAVQRLRQELGEDA